MFKEVHEVIIEKDNSVWRHDVCKNSEELCKIFHEYTEEPVYENMTTTDDNGNKVTTKVKVFDCKGYIDSLIDSGYVLIDKRNEPEEQEQEPVPEEQEPEEEVVEV